MMLVAGMVTASFSQTEDQKTARKLYEIIMEQSFAEYEPLFYADVYFTRNTMVIDISSRLDTETTAKQLWAAMEEEWDLQTKKDICSQAGIVYMEININDKYHNYSFKDKIIHPENFY